MIGETQQTGADASAPRPAPLPENAAPPLRGAPPAPRRARAAAVPLLVFAVLFVVLWLSRANQASADARYTLLLSEHLFRTGTFELDAYFTKPLDGTVHFPPILPNGWPYQIEETRGHIYYHYPVGSSLLSMPFVVGMNLLGWRCSDSTGAYRPLVEFKMQRAIATLLMAALGVVVFLAARLMAGEGASALVAIGSVLATPVYSSSSRGLWSDTWAILLVALLILHLAHHELRGARLRPVLLATLVAWAYFCRPTYGAVGLAVSIWLPWRTRMSWGLATYVATGLAWLGAFVWWSWAHFGTLLPAYQRHAGGLRGGSIPEGLAGILFSPARGLFIYSPVLVVVGAMVLRHAARLPTRPLMILAAANVLLHSLLLAAWPTWWGGGCYGPRLFTGAVPWMALLAAGALVARRGHASRAVSALGIAALVASVAIHARGAIDARTMYVWNPRYLDGPDLRDRLWDWSITPFLIGYDDDGPAQPLLRTGFDATGEPYLGEGWSVAEGPLRWTVGPRATIRFALEEESPGGRLVARPPGDAAHLAGIRAAILGTASAAPSHDVNGDGTVDVADLVAAARGTATDAPPLPPRPATKHTLYLQATPFLSTEDPDVAQRVYLSLNGTPIGRVRLERGAIDILRATFDGSLLRRVNVLTLELPDATSPLAAGQGNDGRELGLYARDLLIR